MIFFFALWSNTQSAEASSKKFIIESRSGAKHWHCGTTALVVLGKSHKIDLNLKWRYETIRMWRLRLGDLREWSQINRTRCSFVIVRCSDSDTITITVEICWMPLENSLCVLRVFATAGVFPFSHSMSRVKVPSRKKNFWYFCVFLAFEMRAIDNTRNPSIFLKYSSKRDARKKLIIFHSTSPLAL